MQLFPLEEAVYKMTGKSASVFGLENRGTIDTGNYADLVIFNPETVIDKASYQSPKLHADGIENVLVNGEVVWQEDSATQNRPGMFLEGKKFH
jgi:N-acyl-D-amino-acid deacylase